MPKREIQWSDLQENIFRAVSETTDHLIITAVAGGAKTSTIVEAANRYISDPMNRGKKVGFVAFNKHIADELKTRLKRGVEARTMHSLGFGALRFCLNEPPELEGDKVKKILRDRLLPMPPKDQQMMRLVVRQQRTDVRHLVSMFKNTLLPVKLSSIVYLQRMFGADVRCPPGYFPPEDIKLELPPEQMPKPEDRNTLRAFRYMAQLVPLIERTMDICRSDLRTIDFDDMIWLPVVMAHQIRPKRFRLLFIDEGQDFNNCQIQFLNQLVKKGARLVVVGDPAQCVVEGTQIATPDGHVRVEQLEEGQRVLCGVGNGNVSAHEITQKMRRYVVDHPVVRVRTKTGRELVTTPEHTHFAGFGTLDQSHQKENWWVYLMYREDMGFRVGTCRDSYRVDADHKWAFRSRASQEGADATWLLESHESEREARYREALLSLRYGIPTWVFCPAGRSTLYTTTEATRLFTETNSREGGRALLRDLGMSFDHPHHVPKCMRVNRRRNFSITMFGGQGARGSHRFSISGSDDEDAAVLEELGLSVRPAKASRGWRLESERKELGAIYSLLSRVQTAMPVNCIEKARLGANTTLPFCPASHVRAGMSIFVQKGDTVELDEVVSATTERYTGHVYDLNVAHAHNYIANGVFTHNCIYIFRGARIDSMDQIQARFEMRELRLSVTYRCPQKHVRWAQRLVPDIIAAPGAIEGRVELRWWANAMAECRSGDLVLCRTNAPLARGALYQIRQGRKAVVRGGDLGRQLIRLIDDVLDVFTQEEQTLNDLRRELEAYRHRMEIENGDDQKSQDSVDDMVDTLLVLADDCDTIDNLKKRIDAIFTEELEGIVFATVHGAKGLEADRVVILEPHKMPLWYGDPGPWDFQQEQNILYVALTRAKHDLVIALDVDKMDRDLPDWIDDHDLDMDDRFGETDGGSRFRLERIQREERVAAFQDNDAAIMAALEQQAEDTPEDDAGDEEDLFSF